VAHHHVPASEPCPWVSPFIRWSLGMEHGEEDSVADLEYGVENGVGTILLNRPEKKNAFTTEMLDEWSEILVEARTDDGVGAIILTGAGDAFCSGGDFESLSPDAEDEPTPYDRKAFLTDHVHRICYALEDLDKPVIAAINGVAVGAGLDFALMCDMRFMASSARVSEGYIRVGLVPGDGGAYYLPRLVGTAKALELLLTGDFIDAREAHRIGMVNRVYEDGELIDETRAFAEKLAAGPPLVTRMIKRAVYQSARSDLRTSLDLISSHMGIVQSMEESHEAFNAFREKRAPRFERG
jgi:enoyl-CoA hydratase/carnithine racemase